MDMINGEMLGWEVVGFFLQHATIPSDNLSFRKFLIKQFLTNV